MEIKVLGTGCGNCKALFNTVSEVVAENSIDATVVKEEDLMAIMALNVMKLPALAIDGKVVSSGKKLSKSDVLALIK